MAKVRVYELAKDLGMESKDVLAKLQEMGEFVRSASSTVEPPVVRKFLEKYPPAVKPAAAEKPVKKAPAKKAAAKKPIVEETPVVEQAAPTPEAVTPKTPTTPPVSPTAMPPRPTPSSTPSSTPSATPRAGNNPFGTPGVPRPPRPAPRPGNNPFGSAGGGPRPPRPDSGQRPNAGGRPGMAGPRPGSVRPGFAARPQQRPDGAQRPGQGGGARFGGAPTSSSPYRTQGGGGSRPGQGGGGFGAPRPGGPGQGGGRPGGARPGAGGAFGKGGGKKKDYKSKKTRREEIDNMQAPTIGGAVVPRGDGNTPVRLRRGASLADFAEKIGADPAALVSVLFHLGEMVTATQSVDEDTLHVLGGEFGYKITVVSPEDEDREIL